MKISNATFYKRHNNELEQYLKNKASLHIYPKSSQNKITEQNSKKLILDLNNLSDSFKNSTGKYEVIILTDIVETVDDINFLFSNLRELIVGNGKLILSSVNPKYYLLIKFFEILKIKEKNTNFSYIHNKKFKQIASAYGFEFIYTKSKQIFPFSFYGFGDFINSFFESTLYIFNIGIKTYSVYRIQNNKIEKDLTKTIIIPAKNEEDNLKVIIDRIPKNEKYEIIISCGKSTDNTIETAYEISKNTKWHLIKVHTQSQNGKANAVWEALNISNGDLIAILDADMSVDPEIIESFFEVIVNNNADFVNGTRLIYEMEDGAMRYLNKLGNRIFQFLIGKVINIELTDSLCGTKVFKKEFISSLFWWQKKFELNDPFGDFDLIFTAAYTAEKISEFPVHYKKRIYGKTQISRFKDGWKLIKYFIKCYLIFTTSKK